LETPVYFTYAQDGTTARHTLTPDWDSPGRSQWITAAPRGTVAISDEILSVLSVAKDGTTARHTLTPDWDGQ
jgi:hypothetical protein